MRNEKGKREKRKEKREKRKKKKEKRKKKRHNTSYRCMFQLSMPGEL